MKRLLLCLFVLVIALSAVALVMAQEDPKENACYEGGEWEGKCDLPTDVEDEWAWNCGWYLAQVQSGKTSEYPSWCGRLTPSVCYRNTAVGGYEDFKLTGPDNSVNNATFYAGYDGTCSTVLGNVTMVFADNLEAADAICGELLGEDVFAISVNLLGFSSAPSNLYWCPPFSISLGASLTSSGF